MTLRVARSAIPAVQAMLYRVIAADLADTSAPLSLQALGLAGVYDHVPETARRPYVVLGEAIETPDNTHDGFGRIVVATLHVWSDYRGHAEQLAICDRLVRLLDHSRQELAGHRCISIRHELTQPLRDPDPKIRHLSVRFRITTEQED